MNGKVKDNKKKRKISIITVFLWIFLVVTMVTITLSNTKNTQALESNGINLELEMYNQENNTPNQKLDKIVWDKEGHESGVVLLKIRINGYAKRDYESGELRLKLLSNGIEQNISGNYQNDNKSWESFVNSYSYWKENEKYIENGYKIKKDQKIFEEIEIAKRYSNIDEDYLEKIEIVLYENDTEILRSNKCELEYNFKKIEEVQEKNNNIVLNHRYSYGDSFWDASVWRGVFSELCMTSNCYSIEINESLKNEMILKLYYIIPKELKFANEDYIINFSRINSDLQEEIKSNIIINIIEDYNDKEDTKVEVIINFEALRNSNYIGKIEIEDIFYFKLDVHNAEFKEIYRIKNYAVWDQNELYSYNLEGTTYGESHGMLMKDVEDIDNDSNYEEIIIYSESFIWKYLLERLSIKVFWITPDEDSIPENVAVQLKNNNEIIREYDITKKNGYNQNIVSNMFDRNGDKIKYTVDCEDIEEFIKYVDGYNIYYIKEEEIGTITTDLQVKKIWEDNENEYGKRPKSITLQLKNGEEIVSEAVVNEENNWEYIFTGIRKYRNDGSIIVYSVDEKETNEFYDKVIDGYRVINKYKNVDEKNGEENNEVYVDTSDINVIVYVIVFFVAIIGAIVGINIVRKNKENKK